MEELLSSAGKAIAPALSSDDGLVLYAITAIVALVLGKEYLKNHGDAKLVRETAKIREDIPTDYIED